MVITFLDYNAGFNGRLRQFIKTLKLLITYDLDFYPMPDQLDHSTAEVFS